MTWGPFLSAGDIVRAAGTLAMDAELSLGLKPEVNRWATPTEFLCAVGAAQPVLRFYSSCKLSGSTCFCRHMKRISFLWVWMQTAAIGHRIFLHASAVGTTNLLTVGFNLRSQKKPQIQSPVGTTDSL